jgi:hypothetical protein
MLPVADAGKIKPIRVLTAVNTNVSLSAIMQNKPNLGTRGHPNIDRMKKKMRLFFTILGNFA